MIMMRRYLWASLAFPPMQCASFAEFPVKPMSVEEDFNGLTLCLCNIEGFDTLSTDSLLAIIPLVFGLPRKQLSATSCELKVSGSLEILLTEGRFY